MVSSSEVVLLRFCYHRLLERSDVLLGGYEQQF